MRAKAARGGPWRPVAAGQGTPLERGSPPRERGSPPRERGHPECGFSSINRY